MKVVAQFEGEGLGVLLTKLKGFENQSAFAEALNLGGAAVRAATVAAETKQTGLREETISRAQMADPAAAGRLAFVIRAGGGNIKLKYFGAKEVGSGVGAHPWDENHFYPRAFINSGFKVRRPSPKLGGQVYRRIGKGRKIELVRSNLFIATELTKGATEKAFERTAGVAMKAIATRLLDF